MEILIRVLQQIANVLHIDNNAMIIAVVIIQATSIIIQIIKKIMKLALIGISLCCIALLLQQAQIYLKDYYGVTFQSSEKAIIIDIGQDYEYSNKQLYIQPSNQCIWINTNGYKLKDIQIKNIRDISISQSGKIQVIDIEIDGEKTYEIITDKNKANIAYRVLKTIKEINSVNSEIIDILE